MDYNQGTILVASADVSFPIYQCVHFLPGVSREKFSMSYRRKCLMGENMQSSFTVIVIHEIKLVEPSSQIGFVCVL